MAGWRCRPTAGAAVAGGVGVRLMLCVVDSGIGDQMIGSSALWTDGVQNGSWRVGHRTATRMRAMNITTDTITVRCLYHLHI